MNTEEAKAEAEAAARDLEAITGYYPGVHKQVRNLFKKQKRTFGAYRSLTKPEEPVALLLREWGDIEIYEGVKQSTFIVPPGGNSAKRFSSGVDEEKIGKRVIYLSQRDLKTIQWGRDKVKAYLLSENDAKPIGGNPRVFAERLEYTIDAVLINYKKFLERAESAKLKGWAQIIIYGALGVAAILLVMKLFGDKQSAQVIIQTVSNATEILTNTTANVATNTTQTTTDAAGNLITIL